MAPPSRRRYDRAGLKRKPGLLAAAVLLLMPGLAAGQADVPSLASSAGLTVTAVEITGHAVTKDYVIRREIHTEVGQPLALETLSSDLRRLENVTVLGQTIYGKNQMLGTAEYSINLVPLRRWDLFKWSVRLGLDVALFTDVGTAWSEPRPLALDGTRGGLGAGLRLLVPGAEMMRFDVGWSPEEGFHFHFAGGSKPNGQRNRLR